MKRGFLIAAVMILSVLSLAACGGSNGSNAEMLGEGYPSDEIQPGNDRNAAENNKSENEEEIDGSDDGGIYRIKTLLNGLQKMNIQPIITEDTVYLPALETVNMFGGMTDGLVQHEDGNYYFSVNYVDYDNSWINVFTEPDLLGISSSVDGMNLPPIEMNAAPKIINGVYMYPIEVIQKGFDLNVEVDTESKVITVGDFSFLEDVPSMQIDNNNAVEYITLKTYDQLQDSRIGNVESGIGGKQALHHTYTNIIRKLRFSRYRFGLNAGDWHSVDWQSDEFNADEEDMQYFEKMAHDGMALTYMLSFWDKANHPDGKWHTSENRFKEERDIEGYLDFAAYWAEEGKDIFTYYEICNEPSRSDSPIQRIDPLDYIELVKRAAPLIKSIDSDAKIIIGATTDLYTSEGYDWLYSILSPEILPLVDGISWHGMGECSPEYDYFSDYYYGYAEMVEKIMETAENGGFTGEYFSDELRWGTPKNHNSDKQEYMYTEITSAKYFARQLVMHLGMDINPTIAMDMSNFLFENATAIKNVCSVLDGAKPSEISAEIVGDYDYINSYSFRLPNGNDAIAVYIDNIASDDFEGVPVDIFVPGLNGKEIKGIDLVFSYEQPITFDNTGDGIMIRDFLIKDYPIIIEISAD